MLPAQTHTHKHKRNHSHRHNSKKLLIVHFWWLWLSVSARTMSFLTAVVFHSIENSTPPAKGAMPANFTEWKSAAFSARNFGKHTLYEAVHM
jgi:hypothetical protein